MNTTWLIPESQIYINEVVLGTAFGVLMGPHVANIFDPRSWGEHSNTITLEIMRVVLATGLFAIGVELPQSYLADHVKGLLVLVVPTMAFGWLVIAGGLFVILQLSPTITSTRLHRSYLPQSFLHLRPRHLCMPHTN